jgi:hypothetical protein
MRLSALRWPFHFLVGLGLATAGFPNPNPAEAVGHVFLLRGNGAVFSRGFGRVCGSLRRAGLWAEDLRCVGDRWLVRHLVREHRANRLRGPVIFIGHSCGGRYALFASQQLEPLGVAVDLLICIDVAWPFPVSGNVRRAIHLYRTKRRLYPARPLRPAPHSAATIENLGLDEPGSPISTPGLHHLNITSAPAVQNYIIERALQTAGARTPERC